MITNMINLSILLIYTVYYIDIWIKNITSFHCSRNLNTRSAIMFTRDDLKRKTTIQRKINPSDCNFKQIGNQNLFLNWGIFAENFPEAILQDLHSNYPAIVNIRKSHLYKERIDYSQGVNNAKIEIYSWKLLLEMYQNLNYRFFFSR